MRHAARAILVLCGLAIMTYWVWATSHGHPVTRQSPGHINLTSAQTWHHPNINSLPRSVAGLLDYTPYGGVLTVEKYGLYGCGLVKWNGSDILPGTLYASPTAHGAITVRWTISCQSGGVIWHRGRHTLDYWMNQNGSVVRFTNSASHYVWEVLNGFTP